MKIFYTFFISFFTYSSVFAINKTATGNIGNGWNNASNWSPSGVPQDGDTATIPAGFTMSVKGNIYAGTPPGIFIDILGTLDFDNSGRIELSAAGIVNLHINAMITSNGASNEILRIDGITKFSGELDGSISGPSHTSRYSGSSPGGFAPGLLPVKLLGFNATKNNTQVILKWNTTEEINSDRFEMERSTDGIQWTVISTITAKGNSSTLNSYSTLDNNPVGGYNLYRLRTVDRDDRYEYSKIIRVFWELENIKVRVGPNPATTYLNLTVSSLSPESRDLQLISLNGRVIKKIRLNPGISNTVIELSNIPKGIYSIVSTEGYLKKFAVPVIIQ